MAALDEAAIDHRQIIAELRRELDERTTERDEALAQQAAAAEVLQIINRSPGELSPVFDAIVGSAAKVCEAEFSAVARFEDGLLHLVAVYSMSPEETAAFHRLFPRAPVRNFVMGRAFADAQPAHCEDVLADPDYDPRTRDVLQSVVKYRSFLGVPIFREGKPIGVIGCGRRDVKPFTGTQIELLKTFADQAAIAIDNARLLNELDARNRDLGEALEQQTATAEVLQVINSSPGYLAPVFDAMLEKATTLCNAHSGFLWTYDGERFQAAATRGLPPPFEEFVREPRIPGRDTGIARLARGEPLVHFTDLAAIDSYEAGDRLHRASVDLGGFRTILVVPLRKDDALRGGFTIERQEVRPFSDKQIALLQNFAAQAVIAMENARLINETREALEQQTATTQILEVINRSPGNLAPVFEAMVERAVQLCEADEAAVRSFDGKRLHLVAAHGEPGVVEKLRELGPSDLSRPGRPVGLYDPFTRGERVVHIADVRETDAFRNSPIARKRLEVRNIRTWLAVALRREGTLLGVINVHRHEVRPFSEKQIALLQNFAAQAVIAIENARLLTETREALEQQTATAEVLQVINSSPGDLAPVFEAILDKAHTLCGATLGSLFLFDGELFRAAATHGYPEDLAQRLREGVILSAAPQLLDDSVRWVHNPDLTQIDTPTARAVSGRGGVRTNLMLPLRKDGRLLGAISCNRQEVRPFTDKDIALLENFAAQAVIAMENARLLTETRAALERQTATAEILRVISSSPTDVQPTFDAIAKAATTLTGALSGGVFRYDRSLIHFVAHYGWTADQLAAVHRVFPIPPGRGSITARAIMTRKVAHVADFTADPDFAHPSLSQGGLNTTLSVPMLRDGEPIGAITITRTEKELFGDEQVDLLKTFADQAVIAIENVRLFNELNERTCDLEESLEYQTATSDVLKVISQSGGELEPVLETLVETAARICDADKAVLGHIRDGLYRMGASVGFTQEYKDYRARNPITFDRGTAIGRMALERRVIHIEDASNDPEYTDVDARQLGQFRTVLSVPLFREDAVIGGIFLARSRVEPFSEKQIELVTTFADQAVIAIENARLLNELRDRTEEVMRREAELRVTFDNMADGVVMFDADMRLAAWNRNFQQILHLPDAILAERLSYADYFLNLAERGEFGEIDVEAELRRYQENVGRQWSSERTRPDGQVIEVRNNPVPGGGLVLIYSDITERKEAEARLRAARDAAEATLRELRAAQANLIQAEKMASLGQLTAGIAHEIKNPLNFVNNFAGLSVELLEELKETAAPAIAGLAKDERADVDEIVGMLTGNLEKIAEHGRRADGIVKSMLEHSRGGSGERREVDLNGLVEEALNLAYHGARAQDQSFNITLERDFGAAIAPVELVPQDITRVCLNLFGNGFYAATKRQRGGGEPDFRPTLKVATYDLGEAVEIRIRDNGAGIPAGIRDKLFQPFFTTKPTGEGTGLGLSISWDIVTQQHGGTIEVDSRVGGFTEFTIRLPRS